MLFGGSQHQCAAVLMHCGTVGGSASRNRLVQSSRQKSEWASKHFVSSQRLRVYSTHRFSMTHKSTESSADFKPDPRRDHAIGGNFLSRGVSKHFVSSQRLRLYSTQRFSMTHKSTESSADFKHDPRRDHAVGKMSLLPT